MRAHRHELQLRRLSLLGTQPLERLVKLYEERAAEGDAEKGANYRKLLEEWETAAKNQETSTD